MNSAFLTSLLCLSLALNFVHADDADNKIDTDPELKIEVLHKPEDCDVKSQKGILNWIKFATVICWKFLPIVSWLF